MPARSAATMVSMIVGTLVPATWTPTSSFFIVALPSGWPWLQQTIADLSHRDELSRGYRGHVNGAEEQRLGALLHVRVGDDRLRGRARKAHLHGDGRAARARAAPHQRPRGGDGRDVHDGGECARVDVCGFVDVPWRARHLKAGPSRTLVERCHLELLHVALEQTVRAGRDQG